MNIWKFKQEIKTRLGDQEIEKNYLVILCNPRSGSTWLFDSLRAHPAIYFPENNNFYNYFRFMGRRYPMDLANKPDGNTEVEVLPGRMEKIPSYQIPTQPFHEHFPKFAIEKIHPEFYKFNTGKFVKKLRKLERKGHTFKFIIQVRHPTSTFQSILKYWSRNPNWYETVERDTLVEHYLKTYQSLLDFKNNFGAFCVKYDDLITRPDALLSRLYDEIWEPGLYPSKELKKTDVRQSLHLTNRKNRKTSGTSFLGKKAGGATIDPSKLRLNQPGEQEKLETCIELFKKLTV